MLRKGPKPRQTPCVVDDIRLNAIETIRARRAEVLKVSQEDIAQMADVGLSTYKRLEWEGKRLSAKNEAKVARALGWTRDSIARIFDGREPRELRTDIQEPGTIQAVTIDTVSDEELHRITVLIDVVLDPETAMKFLKRALSMREGTPVEPDTARDAG